MERDAPNFPAEKTAFYPEDEYVRYLRNAANIYQIIWHRTPEHSNLQLLKPSKVLQNSSFRNKCNNQNYIHEVMTLSSGNAWGKIRKKKVKLIFMPHCLRLNVAAVHFNCNSTDNRREHLGNIAPQLTPLHRRTWWGLYDDRCKLYSVIV
jgi:hypothetical protein